MAENVVQSVKGLSKHTKKLAISASLCTALMSSNQVIEKRRIFS